MLLIYPPVAKPCEPPAGIAKLAGALKGRGVKFSVLDASLEALLYLLEHAVVRLKSIDDRWTARSIRNMKANLEALKGPGLFGNLDRYKRAVADINRALEASAADMGVVLGLANYQHGSFSPVRSSDLLSAAERPEDNPFYQYFRTRLLPMLEKERPSMIGISLNYLSQALCAFAMIGFLRKEFPGLRLVMGGGLVTSWMKRPGWRNPFDGLIDYLVSGPGEHELLCILGLQDLPLGHITPDYSALPVDNYLSPGFILPYSAACGCFWNKCSFCPEKVEANPYVPVPTGQVLSDLRGLILKTNPVLLHLLDNAVSPGLMEALAQFPPGVPWYGFARIDHKLADMDFCRALRRSGCVMLKLGLESGDQGVLDRMGKGITLDTASTVLKNLRHAGIAAYVYLLFGTPTEGHVEALKTMDFTVRHSETITFLNLAVFNMPVNRESSAEFQTSRFYEGDLSLYTDFAHPGGWGRKQVRRFLDLEFRRHPAIAEIIRRDPPVFTSNHAPFFLGV